MGCPLPGTQSTARAALPGSGQAERAGSLAWQGAGRVAAFAAQSCRSSAFPGLLPLSSGQQSGFGLWGAGTHRKFHPVSCCHSRVGGRVPGTLWVLSCASSWKLSKPAFALLFFPGLGDLPPGFLSLS